MMVPMWFAEKIIMGKYHRKVIKNDQKYRKNAKKILNRIQCVGGCVCACGDGGCGSDAPQHHY